MFKLKNKMVAWNDYFSFQQDFADNQFRGKTFAQAFCQRFDIDDPDLYQTKSREICHRIIFQHYISGNHFNE